LEAAAAAVEAAVAEVSQNASNTTTALQYMVAARNVLTGSNPAIALSWYMLPAVTPATTEAAGEIMGTLRLTQGANYLDVPVSAVIAPLSPDGQTLEQARVAAQDAVNFMTVSYITTADDFIAAILASITNPSPPITTSWYTSFTQSADPTRTDWIVGSGTVRLTQGDNTADVIISRHFSNSTDVTLPLENLPGEESYTEMTVQINVTNSFEGTPPQFRGTYVAVRVENAPANTAMLIETYVGFTFVVGNPRTYTISKPVEIPINTNANGFDENTVFFSLATLNEFAGVTLEEEGVEDYDTAQAQQSTGSESVRRVENYVITLDADGASFVSTGNGTITVNVPVAGGVVGELPRMYNMVNGDYRFAGWVNAETGEFVREGDTITSNTTVVAQWVHINEIRNGNDFLLGDTASINRRTSAESVAIARWLIANGPQPVGPSENGFCTFAADINGDGMIDVRDLVLLSRWLVGHDVQVAQ
jgi:hypothetical protein